MKIRIIFDSPVLLKNVSVRYERYLDGFLKLGHECKLFSSQYSSTDFEYATPVEDINRPETYLNDHPDCVVITTWLAKSELVQKIRPFTSKIIALSDSDGYIGAQVHPRQLLLRMWSFHLRRTQKIRSAFWWFRQYLYAAPRVDLEALRSIELSDRVVVFSPGAKDNLTRFVTHYHRRDLSDRFLVAPYPVQDSYAESPKNGDRLNQIVVIGRWDDDQKDGKLLYQTICQSLKTPSTYQFVIVGPKGEERFAPLQMQFPDRVQYLGSIPPAQIQQLLQRSRILLSTSRWESGPIVAAEAMLSGCSLVGPRSIPAFKQFCDDCGCGSTFIARSASAVTRAIQTEIQAWQNGTRDSQLIASKWKDYFTSVEVCKKLLL
jgi:hypothetical protein